MGDILRCTICNTRMTVSDEDPDSTLDDMMHHVTRAHVRDPYVEPDLIVSELTDSERAG